MKLCYPVTTEDVSVQIMGLSGDFSSNLRLLRDCGYEGAELMVRDPARLSAEKVADLLAEHGLTAAAVGVTPAVREDKLTLASADRGVRRAAFELAMRCIDFAAALNAPFCVGSFRGFVDETEGNTRKDALKTFSAIGEYAQSRGVCLLIEPQSRSNGNYLNSLSEGLAWIDEIGSDSVRLILDVFHMHASSLDLVQGAREAAGRYGLVHLCDENRLLMGFGRLDLPGFLREIITSQKYDGFLSTEIKQLPDMGTAAKMAFSYYRYVNDVVLRQA